MKIATILAGAFAALLLLGLPAGAQELAEAAPPVIDSGDTAWMFVSSLLVIMMSLPGVALFYGGLVRAKNVLSILTQVFGAFSVIALLWVAYGYSLAFSEGAGLSAFIGDFSNLFLAAIGPDTVSGSIPELAFVFFQLTFACITAALIVGGIAERMKFGAVMVFLVLWFTLAYLPIAHMVWAGSGLFFAMGALDFAGGTVVHINSGVAALVAALVLGPRRGYGREPIAPHNLVLTYVGACLLWVGWFGFNAGSALAANGLAAQAFLNTVTAPAAAGIAWVLAEKLSHGHASALGFVSGAVAGLVAITPAAGFAGTGGAMVLGGLAGLVCFWAVVSLKPRLGYDDSLDVFGIHGVGGMVGALGTAIVAAPALGGLGAEGYEMGGQLLTQLLAVIVAVLWSGAAALVAMLVVRLAFGGARVSEQAETDGLDLSTHGERAYN
ncbi:MAG: ammonia channel protein [Pelagibacterium sp. SCN 64-44]|nr:MAG: ammonia channel protein [Pelagibacterium sp. SCN 64-44]